METLRRITESRTINFTKIVDYRMREGVVPVACINIERLAVDGIGAYRMQAYATKQALDQTLATSQATFWSRSRQGLWVKGATSGNTMNVRGVYTDCDGDSLIYDVEPEGPTCHTGTQTCFTSAEEAVNEQ